MLFWIFFILLLIAIGIVIYANKHYYTFDHDIIELIAIIYIIVWIVIHIPLGICFLSDVTPMGRSALENKYEELEKNKDNEYLITDIVEWNTTIRFNQKYQKDFWIGVYIPNIYDNYKTIDIKEVN